MTFDHRSLSFSSWKSKRYKSSVSGPECLYYLSLKSLLSLVLIVLRDLDCHMLSVGSLISYPHSSGSF